jgi:hypothetical protein
MANSNHSKEKYIQIANKLRGQKRSQEQKDNISKGLLGHKHSPETLEKMRKPRSEIARLNMSNAMKGRTPWNKGKTNIYSEETIEKLRKANVGKKTSDEIKEKLRNSMISYFKSRDSDYIPPEYSKGINNRKQQKIRNERIKRNGGNHTKQQWEYLKLAFDNKCQICGKKEPEIVLTKDHIIAVRLGGTNDISNIQPLCRSCNSKKR